ncbi:aspartate/glutamate racemase family protein [Methylobacterium terrae]
MATVDFMEKVIRHTPASCDQEHIRMVVCSAADIPDRTAAILGEGPDPLPALRATLRRLEAAGATCIAMPCNTAHHWHAALQAGTPLPILHIADAVADRLGPPEGARIGVLATTGTVAAGIYQDRLALRGYACGLPDTGGQDAVMRAIRLVKAGRLAEATAILRREAEALAAAGAGAVVMACTEIPVALAAVEDPLRACLVDATEALARACVAACRPGTALAA